MSEKSNFLVVKEWLVAIASALIIAAVVRMFIFSPYEVSGMSMYPTFDGDEVLIVNKLVYEMKKPEFGDVIVFHTKEQRDFVKRVIGLPGDKIAIHKGIVLRNGEKINEKYINEKPIEDFKELTVPEGKLFVLGDNRNNSLDSRIIGTVNFKDVVGRADVVVMPFNQMHLISLKK